MAEIEKRLLRYFGNLKIYEPKLFRQVIDIVYKPQGLVAWLEYTPYTTVPIAEKNYNYTEYKVIM